MALEFDDWYNTIVVPYDKDISNQDKSNLYFFREQTRSIVFDDTSFFSPADGIIMYQKIVQDEDEPIVEIKGKNYTLRNAMMIEDGEPMPFSGGAMVVGVFMTFYDIHTNRIPYSGVLSYKYLSPIKSFNYPMIAVEKDMFKNEYNDGREKMEYLFWNARMLNRFYVPKLNYNYYVLQIADYDVSVFTPFVPEQNKYVWQNQRFSFIRWGSQCDLILPIDDRFGFEHLCDDSNHVEAGIDRLVRMI